MILIFSLLQLPFLVSPVYAANPTPVQVYYVPLPEPQVYDFMTALGAYGRTGVMDSIISFVASDNNTIVYYDQWEDGYESILSSPAQATTRIWGDGLASTGCPPNKNSAPLTCTDANDVLNAGDVVALRNNVNTGSPATIDYDGRDKLGATKAINLTRAQWDTGLGTILAVGVDVYDTSLYGTTFKIPAGEDLAQFIDRDAFSTTRLFVMAAQDATSCSLTRGATTLVTFSLNQGQSYYYNSAVYTGDTLNCNKPVQVDLASGDASASYESRWYPLYPTSQWSTTYYSPVGTPNSNYPAVVFIYNGGSSAITVSYTRSGGSGSFTVAANSTYVYEIAYNSGTRFSSTVTFQAVEATGLPAVGSFYSNSAYDWGFTLIPGNLASDELSVGWGPGNGNQPPKSGTLVNGSPIWVTPVDSGTTVIYVDYDGDPTTGPLTDPNGNKYNISYTLSQWASQRIGDPNDFDQTRMHVYTLDGKKIVSAWGQDLSVAGAGSPYLDMGTTVRPLPRILGGKSIELITDNDGDGLPSPGDVLRYTLKVENRGSGSTNGSVMSDTLADMNYIANSTQVSFDNGSAWSNVPDSASGTPFPLDEGYNFPSPPNPYGTGILVGRGIYLLHFNVTLVNPLPADPTFDEVCNAGTFTSSAGQILPSICTSLNIWDWGDAPDTYGTSLNANGPRHAHGDLWLGANFDREANGQPSINANSDDANQSSLPRANDEDGITLLFSPNPWFEGNNGGSLRVALNSSTVGAHSAYLVVWFDWNNNGVFDATEAVVNQAVNWTTATAGAAITQDISFNIPAGEICGAGCRALTHDLVYRARLFLTAPATPATAFTGAYNDGEVEDYFLPANPTAVTVAPPQASSQGQAIVVAWQAASEVGIVRYRLYRSVGLEGERSLVYEAPANTGQMEEAYYEYTDTGVEQGVVYTYWLEVETLGGETEWLPPTSAMVGGYHIYMPAIHR